MFKPALVSVLVTVSFAMLSAGCAAEAADEGDDDSASTADALSQGSGVSVTCSGGFTIPKTSLPNTKKNTTKLSSIALLARNLRTYQGQADVTYAVNGKATKKPVNFYTAPKYTTCTPPPGQLGCAQQILSTTVISQVTGTQANPRLAIGGVDSGTTTFIFDIANGASSLVVAPLNGASTTYAGTCSISTF